MKMESTPPVIGGNQLFPVAALSCKTEDLNHLQDNVTDSQNAYISIYHPFFVFFFTRGREESNQQRIKIYASWVNETRGSPPFLTVWHFSFSTKKQHLAFKYFLVFSTEECKQLTSDVLTIQYNTLLYTIYTISVGNTELKLNKTHTWYLIEVLCGFISLFHTKVLSKCCDPLLMNRYWTALKVKGVNISATSGRLKTHWIGLEAWVLFRFSISKNVLYSKTEGGVMDRLWLQ